MAEFGELASAFVRIRPDLAGFRQELQSGIKTSFREIGTLHVPGLQGAKDDFASVVRTAKTSAAQINSSSSQIVTASRARAAALLQTAQAAKAGSVEQATAYEAAARVATETSLQIQLASKKTGDTALIASVTEQQAARKRVEAAISVAHANAAGSAEQIAAYERAGVATKALLALTESSAAATVSANAAVGASAVEAGTATLAAASRIRTAREQEARDTVAASIVERRAIAETLAAYRALAAETTTSAAARIEANRLAALSATKLGIAPTIVERQAAISTGGSAAELSRLERGAIAGSGAFRGLGRSIAFASLSFVGAFGFVNLVRGAIEDVGNLDNQITRSRTVFGDAGLSAQRWASITGRSLDLAKSTALGAVNTFGTLFNAVGLGQKQSAAFAEDITKVASAASLAAGEADPTKAFDAFRTGLSGRVTYALRQYGIVLDQTLLKSKAIQLGLVPTTADPAKVALAQRKLLEATAAFQEAQLKGSPLAQARAQDAVTAAQLRLRKEVEGTTGALTNQAKAVAAHALIVEQGAKFVDRYGTSLKTSAGQSRAFHQSVTELKEELGGALYPEFTRVVGGIVDYIRSLEDGGKRHQQFKQDLHDVATAGKDFYLILQSLAKGFDVLSTAVGGVGNLVEILGLIYATNKALTFAHAIRESRLALILLGETAPATATAVVAGEAEMAAGAQTLGARMSAAKVQSLELLGGLSRLAKIGVIAIAIDLIINKDDRKRAFDFWAGVGGESTTKRVALDIATLGGHEIIKHFFGGARAEVASQPNLLDDIVAKVKHSIDELGKVGQGPKITTASVENSLSAIAKEIDKGGKLTKDRASLLSQELTAIIASIADSSFSGATKDKLVAKANELAIALATATDQIGQKTIDSLEKSRAAIRSQLKKIGDDIAQQKADMQTAISDAITSASQAERDAVEQAKANLNSLGQSLADFINRFVDAQQSKAQTAPTGPLAKRLKELTDLIHQGQGTPEIIAKAKEVEAELNAQQAKGGGADQTARKERITRRLSDLTDELNTGKIGIAKFNREVTALLRHEGINYRNAGKVLGVAFADGFRVALQEIRAQAEAIQKTPAKLRGTSTGLETQIVKPLDVIREQNKNIAKVESDNQMKLRDLIAKRHELLLKEQTKSNEIAKLQRARLIEIARTTAGLRQITRQGQTEKSAATPLKPQVVPPAELARLKRAHDEQVQFSAKADEPEIIRELARVRRLVLERGTVLAKLKISADVGEQRHAVTLAHEGGRQIGVGLADGIKAGTNERLRELAQTAARAVLHMIRAARIAGRIRSPSEVARDEIGVPLIQGVEVALEGAGLRLGDVLAAQIRETLRRGRVPTAEREIASEGRRAARGELERAVVTRPARTPTSSILDREAIRQATGHPAAAGGLLHRGELTIAAGQRNLLLGEERKHTKLLEQIVSEEKKQTVLLRTERPHLPKVHVSKRTDGAAKEATATAIHNLLGS